jgi:hypothetical protein
METRLDVCSLFGLHTESETSIKRCCMVLSTRDHIKVVWFFRLGGQVGIWRGFVTETPYKTLTHTTQLRKQKPNHTL